jgi:hypothetical protein
MDRSSLAGNEIEAAGIVKTIALSAAVLREFPPLAQGLLLPPQKQRRTRAFAKKYTFRNPRHASRQQ